MSRQFSPGLFAILALASCIAAAAELPAASRQIAQDGRVVPGPAITPKQVRSADHPRFPPGWTCSECHTVTFGTDVISTASRQYWNNYAHLTQDKIWERVVKALPGRERFFPVLGFEMKRWMARSVHYRVDGECVSSWPVFCY